ncbi:hypothetical protein K439DRAFT_1366478, partial [Ramaria rubella]
VIPNSTALPGYPFASLVLNLQAITRAHKDIMDNKFCLVIPIGPKLPRGQEGWEGELCFCGIWVGLGVGELSSHQFFIRHNHTFQFAW